ncbi:MAG: CHAT domain-containing protein [Leptospiraceae bacterium]|nr:CHAT domain-containing protein [Leptospiraceae bacterium]MDW7976601.1 CHAT domain-containing protein [Leptospiraceae bacterium]
MEILNLIIDSVDDIYVFNLLDDVYPSRYLHYKSKIQKSLIREFIHEIQNLNFYVLSVQNLDSDGALQSLKKLKGLSETFFSQFFPYEIAKKIQQSEGGYFFFHVDSSLAYIPWEILYDGTSFLGDKFRIGISINGSWKAKQIPDKNKLRIMILANPTLDLKEASEEGLFLFETLSTEINTNYLDIQLYIGEKITKLRLLSELQNYDIVHFAGHVVYQEDYPEGGILLYNNEILYGHEIERLSNPPSLVFINACRSAMKETNIGLANAFLRAGVPNYIGTNWIIPDSHNTMEFALNVHRFLFEEKTIGDALFEARKIARETYALSELIWASYTLHGNPLTKIFKYPEKRSFDAIRSDWNLKRVWNEYPTFIALLYKNFVEDKKDLKLLIKIFERFIQTIIAIIIETYFKYNIRLTHLFEEEIFSNTMIEKKIWEGLSTSIDEVFEFSVLCAKRLHLITFQSEVLSVIKSFLIHKEDIQKVIGLIREIKNASIDTTFTEEETYLVSIQYILENLLIDFMSLTKLQFFYNMGSQYPSILFKGLEEKSIHILPIFKEDQKLKNFLDQHVGEICLNIDQFVLSLKRFIEYQPLTKEFLFKFTI